MPSPTEADAGTLAEGWTIVAKRRPCAAACSANTPSLRRSESAHREMRLGELVDVVDPDDRAIFERLERAVSREVLDERRDLVFARLLGELGDLEREVARAEDEERPPPCS